MRLDAIGQTMNSKLMEGNIDMFKVCKIEPSPLPCGYVPVDLDVTAFDNSKSHKEGEKGYDKNYEN